MMRSTNKLIPFMSAIPKFSIELLAPAKDAATAIAALQCGADAVYIGAPTHGARAGATNSVADIASVCEYAHQFNARVYVTVNTLVYENELRDVERMIGELYKVGVDALIVQDLGVLRLDIPPIALHASTQCDIRTPEKALFLQELGFSQLVLPRELTLDEIRKMREAVKVPLEVFVHGALCVSYSGACYASLMCGGRSANRGECAQICRLPYTLKDNNGQVILRDKHLLSLRDLNRLTDLKSLIDAGASSLKIEGRLKDANYVRNVVSAYDEALRQLGLPRISDGSVDRSFRPDVTRSFNRGFTRHFLLGGMPPKGSLAGFDTPKSIGPVVATVSSVKGRKVFLQEMYEMITNGDGLNYSGGGFRVNRFEEPNIIHVADNIVGLKPGDKLRRNFDKSFCDELYAPKSAERYIPLDLSLSLCNSKIILEDIDGVAAVMQLDEITPAKTSQFETHRKVIGKLGDTIFRVAEFDDKIPGIFVPASKLTQLRRQYVETLEASREAKFVRPLRHSENKNAACQCAPANVANSLAAEVYREHGYAKDIPLALEIDKPTNKDVVVMTTRYCLRRELGACLKCPSGKTLPDTLVLHSDKIQPLYLDFDCANCQMMVKIRNFAPNGINQTII